MIHRHRVFIDSSFWIAFRSEKQTHHARARGIVADLFRERAQFLSTPFVFAEVHATFSRSVLVREQIIADFWENRLMHLAEISNDDYHDAIALLRQHEDKSYPFCDGVSFVIMQRLQISRVAAFDDHFHQFGEFEVLS
ncbi:MAG: PIN domain-containing protein [Verrucomicrobiales bacterium]|nr:PIN domain-containing protein [Verrucomicrobiales bacterium]